MIAEALYNNSSVTSVNIRMSQRIENLYDVIYA